MWNTALAAHRGGRDEQQDLCDVFTAGHGDELLAVVADGMGGHDGGAAAAATFVETARTIWDNYLDRPVTPQRLLQAICSQAHGLIKAIATEPGASPRSTCVLLHIDGHRAHWAHVGDSRLYWFRDGRLEERTKDHSVPQILADAGRLDEDQIAEHPDANKVTRSLGGNTEAEAEYGRADLVDGDGFLLCTDGLWSTVELGEMSEAFEAPKLDDGAASLVELAAERGGEDGDNISAVLIRMDLLALQDGALRDKGVVVLNELIAVCNDACEAFVDAAKRVKDKSVGDLFLQLAAARVDVREELEATVATLGARSVDHGTTAGAALQLFGKFRTMLLQQDQVALLQELELAEDRVRGKFLAALRRRLPTGVQNTIQNQLDSVLASSDLIKAMKTASQSAGD